MKKIKKFYSQLLKSFFFDYFYNYVISYFPSSRLRLFYLRHVLKLTIGKKTFIHLGCYFGGRDSIKIGNHCVIGRNVQLSGNITIEDHCNINAFSYIQSSTHDKNNPSFKCYSAPIKIEEYAWVYAQEV